MASMPLTMMLRDILVVDATPSCSLATVVLNLIWFNAGDNEAANAPPSSIGT